MAPIPGTKRRTYLEQNCAALDVKLAADEEVAKLSNAFPLNVTAGTRYPEKQLPASASEIRRRSPVARGSGPVTRHRC